MASLLEILSLSPSRFTKKTFLQLLPKVLRTREWITEGISESRARDYQSPFSKMVYDTREEMEKVMGKLSDNSFIREQQKELLAFREKINNLQTQFS